MQHPLSLGKHVQGAHTNQRYAQRQAEPLRGRQAHSQTGIRTRPRRHRDRDNWSGFTRHRLTDSAPDRSALSSGSARPPGDLPADGPIVQGRAGDGCGGVQGEQQSRQLRVGHSGTRASRSPVRPTFWPDLAEEPLAVGEPPEASFSSDGPDAKLSSWTPPTSRVQRVPRHVQSCCAPRR